MTIQQIAATMIRGTPAIVFPLVVAPGDKTWIIDQNNNHVLDVRGWGRLQYHSDGIVAGGALQDSIAEWVVDTLNKEYESSKAN